MSTLVADAAPAPVVAPPPVPAPVVVPPVAAPAPVVVAPVVVPPVVPEKKLDPGKVDPPAVPPTPEQVAAAEKAKADAAAAAAVPLELKYPDGFKGDPAALEAFKPVAKELGLDGPKAQKLVEFFAKTAQAQAKAIEAQRAKWVADVAADPVLGGDKLAASTATVQQGVLWAGGKELASAINELGIGDHPVLARAFHKIGLALKDDSVAGAPGGKPIVEDANTKFLKQLFNHPTSQKLGFGG